MMVVLGFGVAACGRGAAITTTETGGQGQTLMEQAAAKATAEAATFAVAAKETAEASATSTAHTNYGPEVAAARRLWENQGVTSYVWKMHYNTPEAPGTQDVTITVENGQVLELKHDCSPAAICLRLRLDSLEFFTVEGVFDQLDQLAAESFPLAIIRFDAEYGFPQLIVANNEAAPYYIAWSTESFQVIAASTK